MLTCSGKEEANGHGRVRLTVCQSSMASEEFYCFDVGKFARVTFCAALLAGIAACSSKPKVAGVQPINYAFSGQNFSVVSRPASNGVSAVEIANVAAAFSQSDADRSLAERVGAQYLADQGRCGSNVPPYPVAGSHVYNAKHEYWTVSYTCS